jgi:YfiR/HmsC-like
MARRPRTRPTRTQGPVLRAGVMALLCCLCAASLFARRSRPGEYEVKAVYLFNFGKFLSWPAGAAGLRNATFSICVLGQDPFGPVLDSTLAGEKIDGENVVARRVRTPQEALDCRILFISASEEAHLGAIFDVLGKAPVLTVSDLRDFAPRGGMIQFVLEEDKVRFAVNLGAAQKAGLSLSSQLLKVASSVQRNGPSGDRQ